MIGVRQTFTLVMIACAVGAGFLAIYQSKRAAALDTQLTEALRQVEAREIAFIQYRMDVAADEAAAQARQSTMEQEIADYEKALASAGRDCRLDGADLDWLRN